MAEFSAKAKKEIMSVPLFSRHCKMSFLAALIRTGGSIIISNQKMQLFLETENEDLKICIDEILKDVYNNRYTPLSEFSSTLNLNESYAAPRKNETGTNNNNKRIYLEGAYLDTLLLETYILEFKESGREIVSGIDGRLVNKEQSAAAYIRGAFLGAGSVSVSRGYHLEFSLSNKNLANDFLSLLERYSIFGKVANRKERYIVYFKDIQSVSDILALMGAKRAVLELNNTYANRQVHQIANRKSNCDLANIDRTVETAQKQLEAIIILRKNGKFDKLEEKIKEAAIVRETFPDLSMSELAVKLNISKSGIRHRLRKIVEKAFYCEQ